MTKAKLAESIQQLIRDWGHAARAHQEGNCSEMWFYSIKKEHTEKLILFSGALAGMVLSEAKTKKEKDNGTPTPQ